MTLKSAVPPPEHANDSAVLHRYAAKLQLSELLDQYACSDGEDDELRRKIIDLSLAASILSPFTAFVGLNPEKVNGEKAKESIQIPIGVQRKPGMDCFDGPATTCKYSVFCIILPLIGQ